MKAVIFDWGRTLYDNDRRQLFPEAKRILRYLSKKYTLAIVSLAPRGDIHQRLHTLKNERIERYFRFVLFGQTNKDALYDAALKNLRLKPTEIAVVDDRVVRGIKWGNANGTLTVWLRKGKFSAELPDKDTGFPTFIIRNLDELSTIM